MKPIPRIGESVVRTVTIIIAIQPCCFELFMQSTIYTTPASGARALKSAVSKINPRAVYVDDLYLTYFSGVVVGMQRPVDPANNLTFPRPGDEARFRGTTTPLVVVDGELCFLLALSLRPSAGYVI